MSAVQRLVGLGVAATLLVGCTATPVATPPSTPVSSTPSPSTPAPSTPTPSNTGQTPQQKETTVPTPDQQDLDEQLRQAAWDDDVAQSEKLIKAGADVDAKDDTEQNAFLIATSEGYLELLDLTIASGADVAALDSYQGTGVIRAAERGHADVVGRLLEAGVDPDHVNRLGWVALHEALEFAKPEQKQQYVDTTRVLVAGGADVTVAAERDGRSPLQLARDGGLAPQTELITRAAETTVHDRGTGSADANRRLLQAAERGDADEAALALRQGADLEVRNGSEQTPLLVAAAADRVDVARLLVHLGADPDALDDRHDTPWLVTGVTGSVAMLEVLLPANPDLTIKNRFGGLSPIPASERGHVDYVKRVVRTDVDLDHVNDIGWTALLEAVVLGDGSKPYQEIVQTLVDAGVDTSITDKQGRTALELARASGQTEIVKILD